MLSLTARRQLPNRPFLAALRDLIASDPRTPDGEQIVRWTNVGAGGFRPTLSPERLPARCDHRRWAAAAAPPLSPSSACVRGVGEQFESRHSPAG